jgi:hypothetical protein
VRNRSAVALFVAVTFTVSQAIAWRGSDSLAVRDAPAGSRVYIDGTYISDTPFDLTVPCDEVVDRKYRIESPDCGTAEGIANARVRPGVIVGMVFTFGILAAFKCPRYFVPVRPAFPEGACAAAGTGGVLPPPRPINHPQPAAQEPSGDLAERLRMLRDLHDRGVLTDAQYEAEREKALGDL